MPRPSTHPQALKLDEDEGREEAVLGALHAALGYAVAGAVAYRSIQCVVLCVFTLHCCRGRGSADQKQQRQGWHAQLSDALPAGDKAKWAGVGWVDPRLESHATQVRRGGGGGGGLTLAQAGLSECVLCSTRQAAACCCPALHAHSAGPGPQDRFGFEWNQRGQHPTVEAWAEAVRDDWTKFMHKVVCVCGVVAASGC